MKRVLRSLIGLALVTSGSACSDDGRDQAQPPATTTTSVDSTSSSRPTCTVPEPAPRPGIDRVVTIYLFCDGASPPEATTAVQRVVPDDGAPLAAALTQLLIGVTPAEAEAGLYSGFSAYTAGGLRSVAVVDGIATIDFTKGWERTNNFGTAALSGIIGHQIEDTVFGFPGIDGIELRVEGERFCGWETTCDGVAVPLWSKVE